jgi:hypothetical protein
MASNQRLFPAGPTRTMPGHGLNHLPTSSPGTPLAACRTALGALTDRLDSRDALSQDEFNKSLISASPERARLTLQATTLESAMVLVARSEPSIEFARYTWFLDLIFFFLLSYSTSSARTAWEGEGSSRKGTELGTTQSISR